ncbi:DUF4158 domain-containing protein [Nocardiopsis oceani]
MGRDAHDAQVIGQGAWVEWLPCPAARELAVGKRTRPTRPTRLGWAVRWGTVRMLGIFQADRPTRVPERAVAFVSDQLDVDPGCPPGRARASRGQPSCG